MQAVFDKTAQSFRIAYLPFLSSTRTKQLTSLLAPLPHTFLPINDTSLSIPPQAEIILLSRGGKPFAPAYQRTSIDSNLYHAKQERDWKQSSHQYKKFLNQWNNVQRRLPPLLKTLRQHFSDRVIASEAFYTPLKVLAYTGQVTPSDIDYLRTTIKQFRNLRRTQLYIYPILKKTEAPFKLAAREKFGFANLRTREYVIEHHRDLLDLFRFELENRYKGMALVRYPDIAEPKPWILVPEDPVAAWGVDFPDRVGELIELATERFLLEEDEKEILLDQEAREFIQENVPNFLRSGDNPERLLEQIKAKIREDKTKLYHDDNKALSLNGNVGNLDAYKRPITREDKAIYERSDKELVKRGAWRVED